MWQTCGGHTETVFDCKICPSDKDIMATCSYDGTIRLWNIQTMKCDKITKSTETVLYSLAWSPDGHKIAASDSQGRIHLYNAQKGSLIKQLQHHNIGEKVFRVVWNLDAERDLLASISNDGKCIVFGSNGIKERVLHHKSGGRGVAWNPIHSNLLATSCMEGIIYIWDLDIPAEENSLLKTLQGHRYSLQIIALPCRHSHVHGMHGTYSLSSCSFARQSKTLLAYLEQTRWLANVSQKLKVTTP